jgi:3-hydroxybutyryl-CoA dehydratase
MATEASGPLYYDDVSVGDTWDSAGRTVTEADIVNFASMTGDFNPLHVDHEFAKNTLFGRPIAHGLLGLSWMAGLGSYSPWMRTAAFVRIVEWKFLKPIFIGDTIRVHTEVMAKSTRGRGRRGLVTWKRQVMNQENVVVQEGLTETLVEIRAASDGQGADKSETNP